MSIIPGLDCAISSSKKYLKVHKSVSLKWIFKNDLRESIICVESPVIIISQTYTKSAANVGPVPLVNKGYSDLDRV